MHSSNASISHKSIFVLFFKLAIILTIVLILSFFVQMISDAALKKRVYCTEWEDLYNSRINADMLVQGSSRALRHISPKIIEEYFNIDCYNLAMNGCHFSMQYLRFREYLKYNRKPKYIIQCLDIFSLVGGAEQVSDVQQFLPYIDKFLIKESLLNIKVIEPLDCIIPLLKYRLYRNGVLLSLKGYTERRDKYKGFKASDAKWNSSENFNSDKKVTIVIDIDIFNMFDDFLKYCRNNNIMVILVYPPEYYEYQKSIKNRTHIIDIYRQFSNKYGLVFLDYSNSEFSYSKYNFYNSTHMNSVGVNPFNNILVRDMARAMSIAR